MVTKPLTLPVPGTQKTPADARPAGVLWSFRSEGLR